MGKKKTIRPIDDAETLRAFIQFPYRLYQDDPRWVPPLRSEQEAQFDRERNPLLEHCDWQLFLLEEDAKATGRIMAMVDNLASQYWRDQVGLFGYFECEQDADGPEMLLKAARDWLRARKMRCMRGPWTFVSQEWGLVIEGFSPPPVVMAPYDPASYMDFFEEFGLRKAKDLLCWEVSAAEGHQIPRRILELTDAVAKRYKLRIRSLDMTRFDAEIKLIEELSNASISGNWGYSPATAAEVQATARDLRPVIQPKAVLFAEDDRGRAVGFAIAVPDVNHLLKGLRGSLLPFGWLRLLWGIPRLRRYRMFALGVIPEYQGKAVDSLIYRALYEALYGPDLWMEINYVLEDNYPMINAIRKLGARPLRRYQVYEMRI